MDIVQQDLNAPAESFKDNLNKNCFHFCFVIGKGGFGKVWKVESKKTNKKYALKEMSKVKIIDKKSEKSINAEREFLSILNHPFIVNMHYAFQDNDNLYLVMDLLSGGDLRYHVSRYRNFSEEQTRFFIASIVLSLDYIHKNKVIHRDIKPENLVVDDKGYVRITDFGIAKENCEDNSSETSGTPGYMSPEVMRGKNHSFPVDFFAVGVIGYEFMKGKRPYYGHNRKEIKEKMIAKQAMIKAEEISIGWSLESVDFINQLLIRKPEHRLGSCGGAKDLMDHSWLRYYPWKELENKTLLAPFIPEKRDNFDKRYCESIDKLTEETKYRYQEILKKKEKLIKTTFKDYYFNRKEIKSPKNKRNSHIHIEENKPNNHQVKKVPLIYKIPLPYKSRQDNSRSSVNNNNHIPSPSNSTRELHNISLQTRKKDEMNMIKKRMDNSNNNNDNSFFQKMNNSGTYKLLFNDCFLNKIISHNSYTSRKDKEFSFNNPIDRTKVTLLKSHLRSSSVLGNNSNNSKKSLAIPKIDNLSQDQIQSIHNGRDFFLQQMKQYDSSKEKKISTRLNSAAKKLGRSSSVSSTSCMLNKAKYTSIYPSTKD